jgi:lipid-A-disaccharide synthase
LQQHAPKAPSHWAINEGMQHVQGCQLALVASGTATLECTLYGTAMVVAFRTHPINFLLAKALVKVPYIALVNLLLNKEVVKERIQGDCNPQQLAKDLQWLLDQPNHAQQLQQSLREVMGPAHAVNQLADHVLEA